MSRWIDGRRNRSGFFSLVACTLFAALAPATAQTWPTKPIRFVIPFAPGGEIGRAHV